MNKEQGFLLLVIASAALVSLLILLPLLEFVLLAIIVGYVLYPINAKVEPHVGKQIAPLLVIPAAFLIIAVPLGYMAWILYRDLVAIAENPPTIPVGDLERQIAIATGENVDLVELSQAFGADLLQVLFGDIPDILSTVLFVAFGLTVVIFLLYYLLRDGGAFVDWLIDVAPANDSVVRTLADRIDRTTHGVIVGHLFVAILQGVLGGIAFWLVNLPNPVFWAFVMVVLSLLPLIGPFLVWAPAVVYLIAVNQLPGAAFLLLWGLLVVSMVDNYGRPIVIDRDAHLNPAVILIGVFGGIYAIGLTGLFIGPIVLGVLAASMQVFDEEWDDLGEPSATHEK